MIHPTGGAPDSPVFPVKPFLEVSLLSLHTVGFVLLLCVVCVLLCGVKDQESFLNCFCGTMRVV